MENIVENRVKEKLKILQNEKEEIKKERGEENSRAYLGTPEIEAIQTDKNLDRGKTDKKQ